MRRPMQEHEALERELVQLLALEESGGDGGGKWGDSKQRKARVRQIKNRLAAKKSREHARTYVQELEGTLESLQAKNEDLARRLQMALEQNEALMRKMKTDNKNNNEGDNRIGEPAAGRGPPVDVLPVSLPLPSPATARSTNGRRTRSSTYHGEAEPLPAFNEERSLTLCAEPSPCGGTPLFQRELSFTPCSDELSSGMTGKPTTTTASSPVTVPPSPPAVYEIACTGGDVDVNNEDVLMREDVGNFLASGMSEESSSFFDNLMVVPDWASPDDIDCDDITID